MLTQVQVAQVPASDQQAAHDFYVGTLELAVIAIVKMGLHGRWLQVAPDGAETTLALVRGDEQAALGRVGGIVFSTHDIEADVAAPSNRGVSFPTGIQKMRWGRTALFEDSDGNVLVLQTG